MNIVDNSSKGVSEMESRRQMLNTVKYAGGTILAIGISIFLYGFFLSDTSTITGYRYRYNYGG